MTERKRSYKLGNRYNKFEDVQIVSQNWAWVETFIGRFHIWVDEDTENLSDEKNIQIFINHAKMRPMYLNLTILTEAELDALKDLIDTAFEWAKPIVQRRDKEAEDAAAKGEDSSWRYYRQIPQLVYRKRPEQTDGESVRLGSESVSDVDAPEQRDSDEPSSVERDDARGNLDGSLRGLGDDVPERNPGNSVSKDNWPTPKQPPSLR